MTQDEVVDLRFIGEQVRRLGLKVGPMEEQLRHLSSELSHFRQAINLQFQSIELALNQVRIQTNAVDAQLANQQRVLDELLADAAKETPATGKLLRVATEDLPRRFVAWYGIRDGQLLRIERFTDLLACLEGPAPAWGEWKAEAQKDFATAVMQRLEAERAALRQRAEERLSALQERGREILARATYVWTARTRYGGAGVGEINEVTLRSMIHCEGYPYGALARLVSELPEISSENQEWREIEQKTLQQLEALWQWIRTEASQLVEELCKAQEHLATLKTSPRPPRVTVAAR